MRRDGKVKRRLLLLAFTDRWSVFDARSMPWYLFRSYGRLRPSWVPYKPTWKGLPAKLRMRLILACISNP